MKDEIIIYLADNASTRIEVRIDNETVWLNRKQISILFERDVKTIGKHIHNIFLEGELEKFSTVAFFATVEMEGNRLIERQIKFYNIDVIISVGYRVKSKRGIQFRIWANKVLKDYLFNRNSNSFRFENLENDVYRIKHKLNEIDIQLQTNLLPKQGIFFNGQIYDAYVFFTEIIKKAQNEIILIDNYIDETVLTQLSKRNKNVSATIFTGNISQQLQLDLEKHNKQYPPIVIKQFSESHDRFIILDRSELYHLGASLKDLGKKWFAFSRMDSFTEMLLNKLTIVLNLIRAFAAL
jgi:hypothetical protein